MEWLPIESYDKLKKKPKHAAFWFEGTPPARGQSGKYGLSPCVALTRFYGSRVCTHWTPLPNDPA